MTRLPAIGSRLACVAACLVVGCAEAGDDVAGTGTSGGNPTGVVAFALVADESTSILGTPSAELRAASLTVSRGADCAVDAPIPLPDDVLFGTDALADVAISEPCVLRFEPRDAVGLLRVQARVDARPLVVTALADGVAFVVDDVDAVAAAFAATPEHADQTLVVVLDASAFVAAIDRSWLRTDGARAVVDDRDAAAGPLLRAAATAALTLRVDPTPETPLTAADVRAAAVVGHASALDAARSSGTAP